MKAILVAAPLAILLGACASGNGMSNVLPSGSTAYWYGTSSSYEAFNHDNVVCSARAQKWGNVTTSPENRMDRPAQRWPNSAAQEAYDACMSEKGWRSAG